MQLEELVTLASELPMTMPAVEAIAAKLPVAEIEAAAELALSRREDDAAALILMSGLVRGAAPRAELTGRLLPHVNRIDHALLLIAQSTGDRVAAIIDVCESEQLSTDREVALLLLATQFPGDEPLPPAVKVRIRKLARRHMEYITGIILGYAALAVDDEDVEEVAREWVDATLGPHGGDVVQGIENFHTLSVSEVLPERPPEEIEGGYTIHRETPKVGRNEPCPCGSGKKFKRCCGGPGGAAPATEVRPVKRTSPYSKTMTYEQFQGLRAIDLRRLHPADIADQHLVPLMTSLAYHSSWDEAETAAVEMARRGDAIPWSEGHQYELFLTALQAGRSDVAWRQLDRVPEELVEEVNLLDLEIQTEPPGLLEKVEAQARLGLSDPAGKGLIDLSYTLLDRLPALGILVARGTLDPERRLDAWTLLECIETARDRLLLPPHDPAWEVWDRLEELQDGWADEQVVAEVNEELMEEVESLRARLAEEADKTRAIRREMDQALTAIRREVEPAVVEPTPAAPAEAIDPERHAELEARVKELKVLLRESAYQKSILRSQLSDSTRELASQEAATGEAVAAVDEDPLEAEAHDDWAGRPVRLPEWSDRFEKTVSGAPAHIGRRALVIAAELGAAAPGAWNGVKQMQSAPEIRTVRLALSWRLLFRIAEDRNRLTMLEVVHRRDLERALQRYR